MNRPWSILLLGLVVGASANGQPIQDLETIRDAAAHYLRETAVEIHGLSAEVEVDRPDSRLRLAPCSGGLQPFQPPSFTTGGRTTVGVRCAGAEPWVVYLPARVTVRQRVIVAARTLSRRARLTRGDGEYREIDVAGLRHGFLDDLDDLEGQEIVRTVAAGVPITPDMIRAPHVVRRGQAVTLLAGSARVEVQAPARAMADGAVGEAITVKNLATRKEVQGVVLGEGRVRASSSFHAPGR